MRYKILHDLINITIRKVLELVLVITMDSERAYQYNKLKNKTIEFLSDYRINKNLRLRSC
jgi:hypothetical protein